MTAIDPEALADILDDDPWEDYRYFDSPEPPWDCFTCQDMRFIEEERPLLRWVRRWRRCPSCEPGPALRAWRDLKLRWHIWRHGDPWANDPPF